MVMLTAHALNPDALKKSIELGARAYLPKDKLESLVPFAVDVLRLNYQTVWRKTLDFVGTLFNEEFRSDWRKSETDFWNSFERTLTREEGVIIKFCR